MRKVVLVLALGLGFISFGQDKQCETLQSENNALKTENASLKEEVAYFKNVLEVNKPIMETEKDGISFKITKVEGKKVEQGIALTFLLEAKDTDRKVHIPHGSVVDLEGNEFKINFFKSENQKKLSYNTPTKIILTFAYTGDYKAIPPRILKVVRFRVDNTNLKISSFNREVRTDVEFRDVEVTWVE